MGAESKPMNILTVGGSLGGLMTSIALRRQGHNVRILERSSTPLLHDQGAGIVAGGDTQEFLRSYDKTKTPPAVPSRVRLYLDRDGGVVHRESMTQMMTSWDLLYHICRANFDDMQSEYIRQELESVEGEGTAVYEHGCQVTSVKKDGDKMKVSYRSTIPGDDREATHEAEADLVILADGPSSEMRRFLSPSSSKRTYAGYVAFRGTVPESQLSASAKAVFVEQFPFFHGPSIQILAYLIPGRNGNLEAGHRLVNWVWYYNVKWDSAEYRSIFTDKDGELHRYTLPPGNKMAAETWERQKQRAEELLPPQFTELVRKTMAPFVQAITDLTVPEDGKCWLMDGKAVLVGDALAGFRPHTAASTSQAAFHALRLPQVLAGKMTKEAYEKEVLEFATGWQRRGVMLGDRSQFGSILCNTSQATIMSSEPTPSGQAASPNHPNPLSKISAISLFVEDLSASKTFYTAVFGVSVLFEDDNSCAVKFDNLIVNLLKASEGEALVAPAAVGGPDAGRRFQISIWVEDLEKVLEALLATGVNILTGPHIQPWGMMTLTFVDPAGHSWEVAQPVKKGGGA